jgi:hypothetical protein
MTTTFNCWQVGKVTITRVAEIETGGFPPGVMLSGLTEERTRMI